MKKNPALAQGYFFGNNTPSAPQAPTTPKPPIQPGSINVSVNPDGTLKSNNSIADIISQGGPAFQELKDQAKVASGIAGQPKGNSTGNPFTDQFFGIPTAYNEAGSWTPADTPRQAVVTVDGRQVVLPNNFVKMNGIIYKYENGQWVNTNNSLNSSQLGGWQNYLPEGFKTPYGTSIPRTPKPAAAAYDYQGRPLGYGGQVVWDDEGNVLPEVQAQYQGQGLPVPGAYTPGIKLPNLNNISGTDIPNINVNPLSNVISSGGAGLNNLISFARAIKNLGLDPNIILRNPKLAQSLLGLGMT